MVAVIRIKEIHDLDNAALAARAVADTIDRLNKRVFAKQDLLSLIAKHRQEWRILDRVSPKQVLDYLLTTFPLRKIVLAGPSHSQKFNRYLWRETDPLEVAASVRAPKSYLCHSSAVFMHGLVDTLPKEICVNYEQSEKPNPSGGLNQASLDRAFGGKQRQSAFIFHHKKNAIVVLSGKYTRGLEVQESTVATGATVRVTSIERTLIDITVRPNYAGGVKQVLEAYRRARERVSIDKIIATLQKLGYIYPYHQAIGFYMERANYPKKPLAELKALGLDLDFYLSYGMQDTAYSKVWRLHYPRNL